MNCFKVLVRRMSQLKPLNRVGIIGVPFEKGQKKYGVSVAPAAMRFAGLVKELQEIDGLDIKDFGDIEPPPTCDDVNVDNMDHLHLVSSCNKLLSQRVTEVIKDDRIAVTIGGDHSIGVGTVDGHYHVHEDMILIWVDAHADINTNQTSGSGSVHGMPVALLAKELSDYWPYLPSMDWQVPRFSIKNLGYIGLRSVDKYERLVIEKYKIPTFAMEDVQTHGIPNSIEHILQELDPENKKHIHVSFDIDALDSIEAPSTGTPVRGGLTLREGIQLMELIHKTRRLRAIDLVEINPAVGSDSDRQRTIEAGMAVLKAGCFLVFTISASALETTTGKNDKALLDIVANYVNKVPDIEPKYVVSEGLSQVLAKLMNGKISVFPLFRISLKVDRKPVKIPWSVDEVAKAAATADQQNKAPAHVKEYKLVDDPATAETPEPVKAQPQKSIEKVANETKTSV